MLSALIMSMGWEYVSELRPPTSLLFIPHGYTSLENHDGMTSTGVTFYSPTSPLCQSYQQSHLVVKQEVQAKEIMNFAVRSIINTLNGSLTCHKILSHGADGFTFPPKEGVLRIFVALKNPLPSVGFQPANIGSRGKHANHHTTEDDWNNVKSLDRTCFHTCYPFCYTSDVKRTDSPQVQ
jgi:hypothetical protein